jgi:cell division protease FtsH
VSLQTQYLVFRRNLRNNRFPLAIFTAIAFGFFAWMVFGAGQRAAYYTQQGDITGQPLAYAAWLTSAQQQGAEGKLYLKPAGQAVFIGSLPGHSGKAFAVEGFQNQVNQQALNTLKARGIQLEGSVSIEMHPALPSKGQAAAAALFETIGRLVSSLLSLGFVFFMLVYAKNSMRSMSIFQRRFKSHDAAQGDVLPVRFADVAGLDGSKQEIAEVVDYLKAPERFAALGARSPRGVLLYGPPGNGKTLLAKAVAGEAGVPFLEQNASAFVQMFVGAGAMAVRDIFREARTIAKKRGGCVVFIDELDAVGGKREGGGHDERLQTVNALLAEMDGFTSNTGVIVIAATNRLETLDPALLRPGRFDRKVFVPLPGNKARRDILQVHLQTLKSTADLDLEGLAALSGGMSGADLANWVNEAAIDAARAADPAVTMAHFRASRDRILVGPRNAGADLSTEERAAVAWHEAGHAVIRKAMGGDVDKVTIVPHGQALGVTFTKPDERTRFTRESLRTELAVLMAGRAAEDLFTGTVSTGAASDLERASRMAYESVSLYGLGPQGAFVPQTDAGRKRCEEQASLLVADADAKARSVLQQNGAAVGDLVSLLVKHGEVLDPFLPGQITVQADSVQGP